MRKAIDFLSDEQRLFVERAIEGNNILVDACIGSGKTTAIQYLCDELPRNKKILYLTYNKLLKLDAKSKIHNRNVTVTNYHGFAFLKLKRAGISVGVSDIIQTFNREIDHVDPYDVLIIDEYQDIELELADLLETIKASSPGVQIIAVGDMQQKIYDKTTLDVMSFMEHFLEEHIQLEFTKCFRLSENLANMLGRIWHKKIVGINADCVVEDMSIDSVVDFLAEQEPRNILCLGQRNGDLSKTLNILEERYPEKYNKSTVYASISERDARGATEPDEKSAIFTTYDSSKGLERSVCIVFDFTENYWSVRINKPQVSYEILRNIFCVAASRGKKRIIFVAGDEAKLSESTLSLYVKSNMKFKRFEISEMFDFKYKEDVEDCFKELKIKPIELDDKEKIEIAETDGLIDLSPCIGIYQEAVFFDNYDIDVAIKLQLLMMEHPEWYTSSVKRYSLDKKILYLTSLETNQNRYRKQVKTPFVTASQKKQIINRLKTKFSEDEEAQVECKLHFSDKKNGVEIFPIVGYCDVLKDNTVYELKYVSELMHEHYLQCACYMMALGLKKGILWNTKDNQMFEIKIKNEKVLKDKIIKTITKGTYKKYHDAGIIKDSFIDQLKERRR